MVLQPPESITQPSKWSATDPWKEVKQAPGAFPSSPQPQHDPEFTEQRSLAAAVKEQRHDYIRKRSIKIKIGTWNVASISTTHKDLAAWFLQGLGIKGLAQNLSGESHTDESESSDEEHIESVEHQESRSHGKQSTVPIGEVASAPREEGIGIYVLGLQEIIDISSFTEAMRPYYDPHPAKKWKRAVKRGLPHGYVRIAEQQLLGLFLVVYAAPDVAPQISSVSCTSVGTGALGYIGNKGAVSVRIVLGGTTRLLFVNCHLAAGADQTALNRRIWDNGQILSRTRFDPAVIDGDTNPASHESIGDEDFAFWFGDLNFRLDDIPGEDVRRLLLLHTRNEYDVLNKSKMKIDSELGYIDASSTPSEAAANIARDEPKDSAAKSAGESSVEPTLDPKDDPASLMTTITSLLRHDQLKAQQRLGKAFHDGWREGEVTFLPTYKYDIGSVGMFDSGEKKRSPSWCDRILYRTRQDRMGYEARVKQEQEGRQKDKEMQARGLDDQEVLFDYDPETDGADDDDYDEDEAEDTSDAQPTATESDPQVSVTVEKYVSHQRVLSSDHKPLSAVFNLTYDAAIPELKAQVQQEVARVFDKNENEQRPSITVVIDNPIEGSSNIDQPIGTLELNSVEFGEVRYHLPKTRTVTVANTGPIAATFAFINRPVKEGQEQGQFPSWMTIKVHHEDQPGPKVKDDLGASARFVLAPGDVTTIDITVDVKAPELVSALNEGAAKVDDVLVLRILHGRDHFIPVKGIWCPSSFYRYLDELVRFSKGVRSVPIGPSDGHDAARRGSEVYYSAPKELFELAEALPTFVERAVADWTMTNEGVQPPWKANTAWPFRGQCWECSDEVRAMQLAEVREALDTATPLAEHFDEQLPQLARAELLAETLSSFLQSLKDGIVPAAAWPMIEDNLIAVEKSKGSIDHFEIPETVVEALSPTPVHSVCLTFIMFMLTRVITEISSNAADTMPSAGLSRRNRSSTQSSEAPSEMSVASTESGSTLSSFLPSLTRRRTGVASAATSPTTATPSDGKVKYREAYADFWAGVIIRSDRDGQVKGRDKKVLDARKRKVMEALLNGP